MSCGARWRSSKQAGNQVTEVYTTGGGTRSALWSQIKADIYQKPVSTLAASEGGVLGSAILAGVGAGVYADSRAGAERCVQVDRTFAPRPEFLLATTISTTCSKMFTIGCRRPSRALLICRRRYCASDQIAKAGRDWTGEFRGQPYIVPKLEFYECPVCNERVFDPEAVAKIRKYSPAYGKRPKIVHKGSPATAIPA